MCMRFDIFRSSAEVEKLFSELSQDETTAPAAFNAIICGTAKYMKVLVLLHVQTLNYWN